MAKIKLNALLQEIRGAFGDIIVSRTRHGHFLTPRPENPPQWSDKQAAQRTKLRDSARLFYREQMKDPARATSYRARAQELGWPVSAYVMGGYMKHGEAFVERHEAETMPCGVADGRDGADCD